MGYAEQRHTAGDACRDGDVSHSDWPPGRRTAHCGPEAKSDWLGALGLADGPPGGIWIGFIRRTIKPEQSIVAVTVTGSLQFPTIASRRETDRFYRNSTLRDCGETACEW